MNTKFTFRFMKKVVKIEIKLDVSKILNTLLLIVEILSDNT